MRNDVRGGNHANGYLKDIKTSNIYRKVYNQVDKVIAFVYAKKRCTDLKGNRIVK